ncbi:MAG: two-component system sensor kinase [Actinomycetia bacterium]|nr:two-component system sensor kinase [Actinomycetes bacterium]
MRAFGSLLRRVRELPPTVADGLLAALLTAVALPLLFLPSENFERLYATGFRDPGPLAVLLTLCQTVPVTWRRRAPYAVLAVTTAAAILHLALGFKPTFAEAAMVVSLYTVAAHRPRRQALAAALAFAAAMVGYGLIAEARYPSPFQDSLQAWVLTFIQVAAAFFLGDAQKRRLGYMAKLEALNLQLAEEQELRSRWAVAAERSRIARELHDVVAHSVSVMVVQAGAARRTVAASPGQAATALGQIESTGRQALVELRRLLGLLRDDDGQATDAALAPQPSLANLESLAAAAREAGLPVEVTVEGEPRPLPAGVDLSAYRIVQEALTNSLKHAGPARARVRVCYGREAVEVQVTDDGRGEPPVAGESGLVVVTLDRGGVLEVPDRSSGDGHGLIGMRERVALFGGTMEAGADPGGGYRVAARLPLDGAGAEPR